MAHVATDPVTDRTEGLPESGTLHIRGQPKSGLAAPSTSWLIQVLLFAAFFYYVLFFGAGFQPERSLAEHTETTAGTETGN